MHKPVTAIVGLTALFVVVEALGFTHKIVQIFIHENYETEVQSYVRGKILDKVDHFTIDRSLHPGVTVALKAPIRFYAFSYQFGCPTVLPTMAELVHEPSWTMFFPAYDKDIVARGPMQLAKGRSIKPIFIKDGSAAEDSGYAWARVGDVCGLVPVEDWVSAALPMKDPDL